MIFLVSIFQASDVLGKLCAVFVFSLSDGIYVVGISLLNACSVRPMSGADPANSVTGLNCGEAAR